MNGVSFAWRMIAISLLEIFALVEIVRTVKSGAPDPAADEDEGRDI